MGMVSAPGISSGIPVFMKEDLVPIIEDENMIQEMPEEFNNTLQEFSHPL